MPTHPKASAATNYQRLTVNLEGGRNFDLYKTGLFVITKPHAEVRENNYGMRIRKRDVLARGRMRGNTLAVTRGSLTSKDVRELLRRSGYLVKVVTGKRR